VGSRRALIKGKGDPIGQETSGNRAPQAEVEKKRGEGDFSKSGEKERAPLGGPAARVCRSGRKRITKSLQEKREEELGL